MIIMKSAAVLAFMASGYAYGQSALERGKKIVDESLAALGGQRYLEMKDRTETGRAYSFFRERLSGLAIAKFHTRYLTHPEPPTAEFFGVRERQILGKKQDVSVLFGESENYEINFRGATPLPEDRVMRYRDATRRNVLYILRQRLGEPGLIFEHKMSEVYENQAVELVDIVDATNQTVTVYFNRLSKLPVRQTWHALDPLTKERVDEVVRFNKYRDVGEGVQWPFQIVRERNGEKISEIFSEAVTINNDLTDQLFTLPANMKVLKKAK